MSNRITMDSFGEFLPDRWKEIADYLNGIIDEQGIEDDHDAVNDLWEAFCNGELQKTPADFDAD